MSNSDQPRVVAFEDGGGRIVLADQTAEVWSVPEQKLISRLVAHTDRIDVVSFSPDGSLIVTGSLDRTARLRDAKSGAHLGLLEHAEAVSDAAFSPAGQSVVTESFHEPGKVWNAATKKLLSEYRTDAGARSTQGAFRPGGNFLVLSESARGLPPSQADTKTAFPSKTPGVAPVSIEWKNPTHRKPAPRRSH